jgi:hypothetical protein
VQYSLQKLDTVSFSLYSFPLRRRGRRHHFSLPEAVIPASIRSMKALHFL